MKNCAYDIIGEWGYNLFDNPLPTTIYKVVKNIELLQCGLDYCLNVVNNN